MFEGEGYDPSSATPIPSLGTDPFAPPQSMIELRQPPRYRRENTEPMGANST